eukprot:PITA_30154
MQLDLAKTYDKLSWSYIWAVLRAYGFDHSMIRWVMALVSMTSLSILLNGSPSRTFMHSKDLRQWDPLYPFPLCFHDDIPTVKEARAFKQILNEFALAVGIEVSLGKSKVFLFNTDISIQRNLTRILGFQRDQLPSMYLGMPLMEKPLRKGVREPVNNKL